MKRKWKHKGARLVVSLAIGLAIGIAGKCSLTVNAEGTSHVHKYVNGFCTEDGECTNIYEPATDSDNDGYYEIANAGQLYWFSQKVAEAQDRYSYPNKDVNAVLTDNIDLTAMPDNFTLPSWTPIVKEDYIRYGGTFDGQGHTITGLTVSAAEQEKVGLFWLY